MEIDEEFCVCEEDEVEVIAVVLLPTVLLLLQKQNGRNPDVMIGLNSKE